MEDRERDSEGMVEGGWREHDGALSVHLHRADLHNINKHSHRPNVCCQGDRSFINNLRGCSR